MSSPFAFVISSALVSGLLRARSTCRSFHMVSCGKLYRASLRSFSNASSACSKALSASVEGSSQGTEGCVCRCGMCTCGGGVQLLPPHLCLLCRSSTYRQLQLLAWQSSTKRQYLAQMYRAHIDIDPGVGAPWRVHNLSKYVWKARVSCT